MANQVSNTEGFWKCSGSTHLKVCFQVFFFLLSNVDSKLSTDKKKKQQQVHFNMVMKKPSY